MSSHALAVAGVSKRYGAAVAVRDASASFEAGKLHAVIGENGAGKSSLLKLACGLVSPDVGAVTIDGRALAPHTPREAIARGVGMVQQHFALVEPLRVIDNVMLGAEGGALLDERAATSKLAAIAEELGVTLDPRAVVGGLGVGDRQRLEIARVLYKGARTLVLDEPTAVLVPTEADALYATLRRLVDAGRTVIVVTHKIAEVLAHAQTVTVMRKGEVVLARPVDPRDPGEGEALTRAIMGGEPPSDLTPPRGPHGEPVLTLRDVCLGRALRAVSLTVRAGELVGIAGVEGNGQRELVRVIAGLATADSGVVSAARVAVVHEDRHQEGLVLDASVLDNALLGEHGAFSRYGVLRSASMRDEGSKRVRDGGVVPSDLALDARALSGGNQQKVVMARALARNARALVLAQPTRGVDVGAARALHERILAAAEAGAGVLVVSSDLAELRALCGRILVLAGGRVVADVPPDTSNERLGRLMLGEAGE